MYLCTSCHVKHKDMFADHIVLTVDAAKTCATHKDKISSKYCEDCKNFICNSCLFASCSKQHSHIDVYEELLKLVNTTDQDEQEKSEKHMKEAEKDLTKNKACIDEAYLNILKRLEASRDLLIQSMDKENHSAIAHIRQINTIREKAVRCVKYVFQKSVELQNGAIDSDTMKKFMMYHFKTPKNGKLKFDFTETRDMSIGIINSLDVEHIE